MSSDSTTTAEPGGWCEDFDSRIAQLETTVASFSAKMDEAIRLLNLVNDNVKPALDAIASSPVGKMFGLGRK